MILLGGGLGSHHCSWDVDASALGWSCQTLFTGSFWYEVKVATRSIRLHRLGKNFIYESSILTHVLTRKSSLITEKNQKTWGSQFAALFIPSGYSFIHSLYNKHLLNTYPPETVLVHYQRQPHCNSINVHFLKFSLPLTL